MQKSSEDRIPDLLHKYFLVWFQVSFSLGGSALEGLESFVIQDLACHRPVAAYALS